MPVIACVGPLSILAFAAVIPAAAVIAVALVVCLEVIRTFYGAIE